MSGAALNLPLARELIAEFLVGCCWKFEPANADIYPLLESGGEYQTDCLPGDDPAAIAATLEQVIHLASETAPLPTAGRNREEKQYAANVERVKISLYARAALALIGGRHV